MHKIERYLSLISAANERIGKLSAFALILFMLILCYEVLGRYVFHSPTIWAHELSGFAFAIYISLTGAWVYVKKEHVAVDILYSRFSPKIRNIVDLFTPAISLLFFIVLLWAGGKYAWHSLAVGEHSHTVFGPPLGPIKMVIPLGALGFLLQIVADFIQSILRLKGRTSK